MRLNEDEAEVFCDLLVLHYLWNLVNFLDILFKTGRRRFQLVSCLVSSFSSVKYKNGTWLEITYLESWWRGWPCLLLQVCLCAVCWRPLCWQWVTAATGVLVKVVPGVVTPNASRGRFMGKWAGWYRLHAISFEGSLFFFLNFIYFWLCSVLLLWGLFSSCGEHSPLRLQSVGFFFRWFV